MTTLIQRVAQPRSLRAHVEQMLSAAIISGELAPATLLTVPSLAARFEVSATPVREAMLDLEKRGFVESVRNKGFRVTEVDETLLRELVAVRQLLECPAMEQLAGNFPAERATEMRELAGRIVRGARTGDLMMYLTADSQFHLGLTAMVGNTVLTENIAELRSRTRLVGLVHMREMQLLVDSATEHLDLLDLLQAGDKAGAKALMHRHIGHTLGWWGGNLESEASTAGQLSPGGTP